MDELKIEVIMDPHPWDSKNKPYCWTLFRWHDSWCNVGFGWSVSPSKAWEDATEYYQRYVNTHNLGGNK